MTCVELKTVAFLVEHILPLSTADHLTSLTREYTLRLRGCQADDLRLDQTNIHCQPFHVSRPAPANSGQPQNTALHHWGRCEQWMRPWPAAANGHEVHYSRGPENGISCHASSDRWNVLLAADKFCATDYPHLQWNLTQWSGGTIGGQHQLKHGETLVSENPPTRAAAKFVCPGLFAQHNLSTTQARRMEFPSAKLLDYVLMILPWKYQYYTFEYSSKRKQAGAPRFLWVCWGGTYRN